MTVGSVLKIKGDAVTTLSADARVSEAVTLFTRLRIGAAPVMAGEDLAGVFSERDVIHALQGQGAAALELRVADLMTAPAVTVTQDHSVISALALMTEKRIRHLPVWQGERLVGIVSIGDLVKYRIDLIERESATLRDYIQSA